ncbi:MAG: hemerythrin [Candidatus Rokuibacteriota bacterium]|nr:MAG: hemerythrin [Candidatus Rokubacteria bacterium]
MTATNLLKKQHQEVKSLFRRVQKTEDTEARHDLRKEIINNLTVHAKIEEEIFYLDLVLEAYEEHHVVKLLLEDLSNIDAADKTFTAKMTVLGELVEHHADEEEKDMFPLAQKLGEAQLEAVGERMAARVEALTGQAAEPAGRGRRR